MFYDLETQQQTGTHVVKYVHVWDFDETKYTFSMIESFSEFVFNGEHQGYTLIAHNAKSFHAQFIIKYCIDNAIKPFCIYNGTKIMYMSVSEWGIRFIDSINFVAGALARFPKTFGLHELKKEYLSHYFNTPENQHYIGHIPPIYYYDPDHMKPDTRTKFLKWHQDRVAESYVFDFQKELKDYCRSDVDILRRGMMMFRENFLKIANIDPLQYITISSVCMTRQVKKQVGVIKKYVQ